MTPSRHSAFALYEREVAQCLWESSKMEQRYDAVLGVIRDGFTVTEVAQKWVIGF